MDVVSGVGTSVEIGWCVFFVCVETSVGIGVEPGFEPTRFPSGFALVHLSLG
jgi:hypothetical protein